MRAAERGSFIDLAPAPAEPARRAAPRRTPPRRLGLRHLPAPALAAVALLTIAVPRDGIAPELSPQLRVAHELNLTAYWRDLPSLPPVSAQPPTVRKHVAAREKPARMIDNAIRQRAFEAVERAIATESPT